MSPDSASAETDELRVAERSNPQIKSYVRPEEAAEKGVKAVVRRDDIGRHLTSEVVFSGDSLPGFSDTIEHPDGLVLVDTGMIDTTPAIEEDGEEWHPYPLPDDLVSRVAVVVNTHLHFDHCGGNRLFPGIPIHVQRRELADARTENNYTVREWVDFPGATYVEHDGEAEILPGVRLLPAPGHTAGHQIVVVETRSSSAATSATGSRSSNAGKRRGSSSSSNSRRRPTSRMSPRCVSRSRGRRV
jgi:glyoxylase-like metal-dependent hydrolase (beta-lactamase superfamily II)